MNITQTKHIIYIIAQQIERQQAARIVGAERDLAAGVGRNRHETLVGIAVGNAFADDRIPEQHARFGRLPRVVDDLLPEFPGYSYCTTILN